jgi:hypothetical protein
MPMGNLNDGLFPVNLHFDDVVGDMHAAVFSYAIMNNGNQSAPAALLAVENATKRLAQVAVQAVAKLAGEIAGAALGTEIGTAIVPLIGSAQRSRSGSWFSNWSRRQLT